MKTSLKIPIEAAPSFERRFPELDGLRGIAILLVLIWHYGICQIRSFPHPAIYLASKFLSFTWSGVDLFFVLSGFLLGGILLDNKNASNFFQVFYVRRFCRILPLYFLWITIGILIVCIMLFFSKKDPFIWLFGHNIGFQYYATLTQNFLMARNGSFGSNWLGITWSLAIEEQFYLILPLLIYIFSVRRLWYILIFLICMAPILRVVLFITQHTTFPGIVMMPCRSDALLVGVLCALALRKEHFRTYILRHISGLYALAGVLLGWLMVMILQGQGLTSRVMTYYGFTVLAVFYACILLIAVTEKQGPVTGIVRNPWFCKLGIIAYGAYLFHQGISELVHAALLHQTPQITHAGDALVTIFALFLTIICARFSWMYFEKPIVTLGHAFRYNTPAEKIYRK